MVLPVTLLHHDDEAALDFVARLAIANGYPSLRDFLAHTDNNGQRHRTWRDGGPGFRQRVVWGAGRATRTTSGGGVWCGSHLANGLCNPQQGHAARTNAPLLRPVRVGRPRKRDGAHGVSRLSPRMVVDPRH